MEIISVDLQAVAGFLPLIFLSVMAFWKENAVLFMLTAAAAMLTGLYSPDIISGSDTTAPLGIAVGLALMTYSLFCIGMAFRLIFWKSDAL